MVFRNEGAHPSASSGSVDSDTECTVHTGIVHNMSATAANAHDVKQGHNLLHGARGRCGATPGIWGAQAGGEPGAGSGMAGSDASRASPDAGGEGVGRLSVVIAQVGKGWNCRTVARSMVQEVSVNS